MRQLILLFILVFSFSIFAQETTLFVPLNIQNAYENGTRNYNGNPGDNYWQNYASYTINAEIDPVTKILKGKEKIVYFNESPDSLNTIAVRLYQDIYKEGAERDIEISPESITDGVVLTKVVIADSVIDLDNKESRKFRRRNTMLYLRPDNPIAPGSSVDISFEWHFTIPADTKIRMGEYDSTTFFIGYWYPQISVYDDLDGWDRYEYVGHEFYNDFNNYDVKINVPSEFNVWATGELQNPDEIYSEKILEKYEYAMQSDTVIHIITEEDLENGGNYNSSGNNEFHFVASKVPDFAFGMSDHYLWDGVNLKLDNGNRNIFIGSAYKKEAKDFYKVAEISKKAIEYFSTDLPGVPYPYPAMTVFNGLIGGGMEYPMIVNNASIHLEDFVYGLAAHEIAHTYFPFYMGINEHKYAWLDEGFATFLPFEFEREMVESIDPVVNSVVGYERLAGDDTEFPTMVSSKIVHVRSEAFNQMAYSRASVAYYILKDLLGKELFKSTLIEFMRRWEGKHPTPYDFFFTFNKVTEQNLNWFWNPWFFDFGYPELEIVDYSIDDGKVITNIKRTGNVPVPLSLTVRSTEGKENTIYKDASIWKDGKTSIKIESELEGDLNKIILGNETIPDVDRSNNEIVLNEMKFQITYTQEDLQQFTGTYKIMDNLNFDVYIENGKLYGRGTNQPEVELIPDGANIFKVPEAGLKLEFVINKDNKIGQVIVNQGGYKIPADKIK